MSGLLALLDDVAAIAKVAATSVDDIAAQAAKAGTKAAGVLIDDAAVTPKYVHGFEASRELPIIWKITKGSLFNKLVVLLPAALLLNAFAPWAVTPLLMLGGAYLCFEGAEKVFHALFPHSVHEIDQDLDVGDPAHLEETRVKGAIKTDFILSAEIMTIVLSTLDVGELWFTASALAFAGVGITAAVYGSVALIVKMDDIGLLLAQRARTGAARGLGRGLVRGMPKLLTALSFVGTLAMLWVGGSIILHGLEVTHLWAWPYETIHHWAEAVAHAVPQAVAGFAGWLTTAVADGVIGLGLGLLLVPVVTRIIGPIFSKKPAAH